MTGRDSSTMERYGNEYNHNVDIEMGESVLFWIYVGDGDRVGGLSRS